MLLGQIIKRTFFLAILFGCLSGTFGHSVAGPPQTDAATAPEVREAVRAGVHLERSRDWLNAIEHYEKSLKEHPESKDLQYGLRRSKIHFGIDRRYTDRSFERKLLTLSQQEALNLFDEVLRKVKSNYVDPVSSTSYVAHGTESLYLALANEKFLAEHLQNVDSQHIQQMRKILRERFWNKPLSHRSEAYDTVVEVSDIARNVLGIRGTPVVLEYVFGGCNALDDYSNHLTPDRLDDLYGNIEGEFVGLGIEMKAELGQGLLLVNVLAGSPAELGGLVPGDRIVSIDGLDCRELNNDEAARILRGPSGSSVHLRMLGPDGLDREGEFTRRPVVVQSIPVATMLPGGDGFGYIRMIGFQKSSAEEMDAALEKLSRQGMRALVWDLRGNPGGLLTAAVEVLDRFINDGMLVSTRGRTSDQNWSYSAHRSHTWQLPLVLLVDGDSASASEIVAGAVRDHGRGVIVGRTTYGKWSVQSIFPMYSGTGLRLTTAKFYSPKGHTLSKIGVRPDVEVERDPGDLLLLHNSAERIDVASDPDLRKSVEVLRRRVAGG